MLKLFTEQLALMSKTEEMTTDSSKRVATATSNDGAILTFKLSNNIRNKPEEFLSQLKVTQLS